MIEIIPGILDKDFGEIKRKIEMVKDYVDLVEIDVLDNTLYKNDTYNKNWEAFREFKGKVRLGAHLMVQDPLEYVEPLAKNGFSRLIADVGGNTIREFIHEARIHNVEVGVALDGPAPIELIEPYLELVDTVLLMTIKTGHSGTPFLHSVLPKIKLLHENYPDLPIQVDGGINKETAPLVIEAGATRLISTSYLFWNNAERIPEAIEELKGKSA